MGRPCRNQRGATGLLVIVFALLAALCATAVVTSAPAAVSAGRAQSAADAAALAAAAGGDAVSVAAANGADVLAVVPHGNCVEVKVRYQRHVARARAQFDYPWPDRPGCR